MKPKVYMRADGGRDIGLGHLVRCLALAQMLKEDFDICFACKMIPENMIIEFKKQNFSLLQIDSEEEFVCELSSNVIVVLDNYDFDSAYQKKIKAKGCKLVCIDDLNEMEFFADLVINPTPGIHSSEFKAQLYTQFAIGLDYVLLRPEFLKAAREQNAIRQKIETVFVCFGGSDSKNLSQITSKVLKEDVRIKKIIIVTGSSYTQNQALEDLVAEDERFRIFHAIDEVAMCQLIRQAQLAIVPASGVLQEVIAVGCRVISGTYVDNQKRIFERYNQLGALINAKNFAREDIRQALDVAFSGIDQRPIRFIDGNSDRRLRTAFIQLIEENKLTLRKADTSDVHTTFNWASDKRIRAFSFNTQEITFDDHNHWFSIKVADANSYYFIASFNEDPVGSIRFDVKHDEAFISYLIDANHHSKGMGLILLKKGVEKLVFLNKTISKVIGYVMPENIPSIKAFERLGYIRHLEGENYKFEKNIEL